MPLFHRRTAFLLALLLGVGVAHAQSRITLVTPERYTDVREVRDLSHDLQAPLEGLIRQLVARHLPSGQSLSLELTDVDLAGEVEPVGPQMQLVRFLRPATWPRLSLHYTLKDSAGDVLSLGDANLSDLDYLNRPGTVDRSAPLPYEQALLTDWFMRTFVNPPAPSASPAPTAPSAPAAH